MAVEQPSQESSTLVSLIYLSNTCLCTHSYNHTIDITIFIPLYVTYVYQFYISVNTIAVFIDPVRQITTVRSTCIHNNTNTQKQCTTVNKIHNAGIDFVYYVHVLV